MTVKRWRDKHSNEMRKLRIGEVVYFEYKPTQKWIKGKIIEIKGQRTYLVKSEKGGEYRRNRFQVRPSNVFYDEHLDDEQTYKFSTERPSRKKIQPVFFKDYVCN